MSTFWNPIKNAHQGMRGAYASDSGVDILVPEGTPVYCPVNGVIEYAEEGHTSWREDQNRRKPGYQPPHSVRIRLANPWVDPRSGRKIRWVYITHMRDIDPAMYTSPADPEKLVKQGRYLGTSGWGNNVAHIHVGLLFDPMQDTVDDWLPPFQAQDILFSKAAISWGKELPLDPPPATTPPEHNNPHWLKAYAGEREGKEKTTIYIDGKESDYLHVEIWVKSDEDKVGVKIRDKSGKARMLEVRDLKLEIAHE